MSSPTSEQQIDPRFQQVLNDPLPDAEAMDSAARIARINLYKEMVKALPPGMVPEEHLRFGVKLITIDRAAAAKEARSSSSAAKKASKPAPGSVSLDDL